MAITPPNEIARTLSNAFTPEIQVDAYVSIGNKRINYSTLYIDQTYGDHHYFEIKVAFDILQKFIMPRPNDEIELIGEKVFVEIQQQGKGEDAYLFKGIITDIELTGNNGEHGYTLIKGASPTILLDRGKRYDAYSEKTLFQIFDLIGKANNRNHLSVLNNPTYEAQIDFQMQYNESDWKFIRRMCYQYGVNIFFSGFELLIGDYKKEWEAVPLTYDKELSKISLCSKLLPAAFTHFTYDPEHDDTLKRDFPQEIKNASDYVNIAQQKSVVFKTDENTPYNPLDIQGLGVAELDDLVEAKQSRIAAQTIYIKGESKIHKSTIGRLITVELPKGMSPVSGLGTYRVVKSTHFIDANHHYHNTFEAVPASLKTVPFEEPPKPIASSIEATVSDTKDPKGQGRVRVEFPFKMYGRGMWLRVMTPDGGLTADGGKNRGLVFIPEKGTKVIVDFQMNNPAFPYVAGALFHGKNGQGGGDNNSIKSIITRNGIQIVFNDDAKSLHIADASGNTWDMDGNGNINVFAPKQLKFNATDIEFCAKNDMLFNTGRNFISNVGQNTINNTNHLKLSVVNFAHLDSGKVLINSSDNIKLESPELYTIGQDKLYVHSDKSVIINSKGSTDIKGEQGHNFINIAEDYEPSNEINAKAIVMFTPIDRWKGEFGFDWMRIGRGAAIGQSNTSFDVDYNTIMGYYPNNRTSNTFVPDADNNGDGIKDMYAELKKEYKPILMIHKLDAANNPLEYFIPILRIYRHPNDTTGLKPKAYLKLQIEVIEEPDSLVLEYDSNCFSIKQMPANIQMGAISPLTVSSTQSATSVETKKDLSEDNLVGDQSNNQTVNNEVETASPIKRFTIPKKTIAPSASPHTVEIEIECIDNFSVIKDIKAVSIKKDANTNNDVETLAGIMKVMPNNRANRKIKKIVFVNVIKKDLSGNGKEGFVKFKPDNQKYTLRNILRQAYVDPMIEHTDLRIETLASSIRSTFNSRYLKTDGILCYDKRPTSTLQTVDQFLRKQLPVIYQNPQYTCIFYFDFTLLNIEADGATARPKGYSNQTNRNIVMGELADDATPAHEILHDLKLEHIFEHKSQLLGGRQIPKAKHSFRATRTKNIMDYTSDPRYFMYNWQAVTVNGAATAEPQNYTPQ